MNLSANAFWSYIIENNYRYAVIHLVINLQNINALIS